MKVLIIGGTGHIGSYLVPRLVTGGHEVAVVARRLEPQHIDARLGFGSVEWILADRGAEEADGSWAKRMAGIEADVVVDLICYSPEQNRIMVEAFEGEDHALPPLRDDLGLRTAAARAVRRER